MRRAPSFSLLICITVAACSDSASTDTTDATGTTTDTGESGDTLPSDTDTSDTGETDTGEPEVEDPLRFVAYGSFSSVLLALNLDDPHDIPSAELITPTGTGLAGMFGPTPSGAQVVTHEGSIEQLRLSDQGEFELSSLAPQEGHWLASVLFSNDGANALMSVSTGPDAPPNLLLWVEYDDQGQVTNSWDITPPLEANGAVFATGRSPDSSHAAILLDVELDGVWQLFLMPLVPEPMPPVQIDSMDLTGIPANNVPLSLWLHLDDQRIAYRKEVIVDVRRPVGVALDDPGTNPINIVPGLPDTHSIVWSDDGSHMLVSNDGADGYRELRLVELDGPTSSLPPILLTEPGEPALLDSLPPLSPAAPGHGFDALGRVWYAHAVGPQAKSLGISLVTVTDGMVAERLELAELPVDAEIDEITFDPQVQVLGYRVHTGTLSWIHYIDLSAQQPASIRVDQEFEHAAEPVDNASYGWSADGSRIVVAGIQQMGPMLHVAEIGDPSGATVPIMLPDVEGAQGVTIDHRPLVSPNGDQVLLWYSIQTGYRGLIHAPTDGSASAEVALGLQHTLWGGTYMPHTPD